MAQAAHSVTHINRDFRLLVQTQMYVWWRKCGDIISSTNKFEFVFTYRWGVLNGYRLLKMHARGYDAMVRQLLQLPPGMCVSVCVCMCVCVLRVFKFLCLRLCISALVRWKHSLNSLQVWVGVCCTWVCGCVGVWVCEC